MTVWIYWVVIRKDQRPISEEQEKGKANDLVIDHEDNFRQ
jgi:hypothetical protein